MWRASLATAHSNSDNPELAGPQASAALRLAISAGSGRVLREVQTAAVALQRHSGVIEAADFAEKYFHLHDRADQCED